MTIRRASIKGIFILLVLVSILRMEAAGQANWRHTPDFYELQARLYLGNDDRVGSLFEHEPTQRALFGFPLEPISQFKTRSSTYPDFERTLLSYIWQTPAWEMAGKVFPDGSGGLRTKRTDFVQRLEQAGFSEWTTLDKLWEVRDFLAAVLGADRVLVSCEGFNAVGKTKAQS